MTIGQRIKALRIDKGKTQKELALDIKVSVGTIGMYEIDERTPPPDKLQKLATVFGVSIDYLLNHSSVDNSAFLSVAEAYKQNPKIIEYLQPLVAPDEHFEEFGEILGKKLQPFSTYTIDEKIELLSGVVESVRLKADGKHEYTLRKPSTNLSAEELLEMAKSLPPEEQKALIEKLTSNLMKNL